MKCNVFKSILSLSFLLVFNFLNAQLIVTSNQEVCVNSTVSNLTATPQNGFSVRWYSSQTGGSPLSSSTVLTEATYYASQYQTTGTPTISTFAGSSFGNSNGTGTGASFIGLTDLVFDSNGNLFVVDNFDHRIRKITPAGVVTYFAGSGSANPGFADGNGVTAKFNGPTCITIDSNDNLYVTDTENNRIRKITPSGYVTTFAGSGVLGSNNGTLLQAQIAKPIGIATDSNGNIFVTDYYHKIRKIDTDGNVTDFAGSTAGAADGIGNQAKFYGLANMTIDNDDNIYVSDYNRYIRKITPEAVVTTLAGNPNQIGFADGYGSNALFNMPRGLDVDDDGNIWVAVAGNNSIRKITPNGDVTTVAGSQAAGAATDGPLSNAQFNQPHSIIKDGSGNFFLVDYNNYKVRKISIPISESARTAVNVTFSIPSITGVTTLNSGTTSNLTGSGTAATNNPWTSSNNSIATVSSTGIVSGISAGTTLITYTNHLGCTATQSITVTHPNPTVSSPQVHCLGATVADLTATTLTYNTLNWYSDENATTPINANTALSATTYYVSQSQAPRVESFVGSTQGSSNGSGSTAQFNNPFGIDIDTNGNLYVADRNNHVIRKITPNGVVSTFAGNAGNSGSDDGIGTSAKFNAPTDVVIDANGNLYVSDEYNHAIRKITPSGVVTTIAGTGSAGSTNGNGTSASFNRPYGVTVDSNGNIFVSDTYNHLIRKITPTGTVTTFAGSGTAGFADGTGTNAIFNRPYDIDVDDQNNLYIADRLNHRVRKISPLGVVTTLAGNGTESLTDGTGTAAAFNDLQGVAIDAQGNVFVADEQNRAIRKITPNGVVSTYAGTGVLGSTYGLATEALITQPRYLAVDQDGYIYFPDTSIHLIKKISPQLESPTAAVVVTIDAPTITGASTVEKNGTITLTGSGTPATNVAWTSSDTSVATVSDSGVVTGLEYGSTTITYSSINGCYVTKTINVSLEPPIVQTNQEVCPGATVNNLAASLTNGVDIVWYSDPDGLNALNGTEILSEGTYYVKQTKTAQIEHLIGNSPQNPTTFNNILGITKINDNEYILSDSQNIKKLYLNTNNLLTILTSDINELYFLAFGIDLDANGNIYFLNWASHRIEKINADGNNWYGNVETLNDTSFLLPNDCKNLVVSPNGIIYVTDPSGHKIYKRALNGAWSVYAGSTLGSNDNTTPTSARFNSPRGIDIDSNGNLFVADYNNNKIRKIDINGVTSTFAVNIDNPDILTIDDHNNIFTSNGIKIYKITPEGDVSTVVGGFLSTQGTFNMPYSLVFTDIAVDSNGDLVVTSSETVKKIIYRNSESIIIPVNVTISNPTILGEENVVIGETITLTSTNNLPATTNPWTSSDINIATVSNTGEVIGLYPGTVEITYNSDGGCSATKLINVNMPQPVVNPNQILCSGSALKDISDIVGENLNWYNNNLQAVSNSMPVNEGTFYVANSKYTKVETFAGTTNGYLDGDISIAKFISPSHIAIDSSANLYVADGNLIRKIDVNGNVTTLAGNSTSGFQDGVGLSARFNSISDIKIHNNVLYVADVNNNCIRKILLDGTVSTLAGSGEQGFLDGAASIAKFYRPGHLTILEDGTIYISDYLNHRIRKLDTLGNVSTFAGSSAGYANGIGSIAKFAAPSGIIHDSAGNLFVADQGNNRIRKITPTGLVSTYAGTGLTGNTNGNVMQATFDYPTYLTIDNSENIYVTSQSLNDYSIRKISSDGLVTRFAGNTGFGYINGPLLDSKFRTIKGITISNNNDLYICDRGNYRIRKIPIIQSDLVPVSITIENPEINGASTVFVNESETLTATGTPATTSPWTSSDESIATVSNTGEVTGISSGSVIISYTTATNCTASKAIEVKVPVIWDGTAWSNTTGPTASLDALIDGDLTITEDLIANSLLINTDKIVIVSPTKKLKVMGDLKNNGQIIFKSDATGDGYFDEYYGAEISGTGIVKTERYIPARRAFRFLSPSVTTTTSIYANWQENGSAASGLGTHITGTGGATNGFDVTATNNPSMYGFDNTIGQWQAVTNTNMNTLTAGTPYRLMVRGDRTTDLTTNTPTATVTTLRVTGSLKTGDFSPTLNQAAEGYSFIGNPYQAPLDMEAVLINSATNMNTDVLYYWDPTINIRGGYVTRTLSANSNNVTSDFTEILQPGQAVFVKKDNTATAATMTISETHKSVADGATGMFRSTNIATAIGLLRANLQANINNEWKTTDAALALFNDSYSWDVTQEDASKMNNLDEEVSFILASTSLAIAKQNDANVTDELPIRLHQLRHTNYRWVFDLTNYNGNTPYLLDTVQNTLSVIEDGTVLPFTAGSDTANRFTIIFQSPLSSPDFAKQIVLYPNPGKGDDGFYIAGVSSASVRLYNVLGQEIPLQSQANGQTLQVMPKASLSAGVYSVHITQDGTTAQIKWIVD